MAARTKRYSYFGVEGFGGGLVSENPIVLSKNQMVVSDNILIGTTVSRRKRPGQEKYHTGTFDLTASYPVSGVPIRNIRDFWRTASLAGNPVSDLFLHQGAKVWSIDDRNTIGIDRTGALVLDTTSIPCYQPFNQLIYFCSTVTADGYNKWDGASSTAIAATDPADGPGKYLCTHFGRMVMAGNDDYPFRAYLSVPFDAEDWSSATATSLDVDADGDPEGITGICSFQSRLYIFVRNGIYEVTGASKDDFVVNRISDGIGCLAHATIVQIPNDVIFASDRGVHSLRQVASGRQTESTFLSKDIQKLWTTLINTALYKRCIASYDEPTNNYLVSVPSSGQITNDQILAFNIEQGTWTVYPNISARSLTRVLINNKKQVALGREDGTITLLNENLTEDLGVGYTARFLTGVLYPGGLDVNKVFKSITVLASTTRPSNFTIGWNIDGKYSASKVIELTAGEDVLGSTFVLGQSRLGVGQYVPHTIPIDQVGYGIQVDISCGGDSDMEVYGFILEVEDANPEYS